MQLKTVIELLAKGGGRITEREKIFAQIYSSTHSATDAYIEAGYKVPDRRTAAKKASRLKQKKEVKQYIEELQERERKKRELDKDRLLEFLSAVVMTSPADMADIVEVDGEQRVVWKSFEEMDKDAARAIAVVKNAKGGIEVEMLDRLKAFDMLMKHLGLDRSEGGVVIKGEEKIED